MADRITTTDTAEQGFLEKLRASPSDADNRTVYADWLEERAQHTEAEFLRLQLTLRAMDTKEPTFEAKSNRLRELAPKLDQDWRMLVSYAPIEKCEVRYDFHCPKQWQALAPTNEGDNVRFCDACKKNVHYATSVNEAFGLAIKGKCVVVDLVQLRKPHDLDVPAPVVPLNMPMPMPPGGISVPRDWQPSPPPPLPLAPPPSPPPPPRTGTPPRGPNESES